MKKIIAKEWRTGGNCVGIVAVEQEHNKKWRAYIGVGVHTILDYLNDENIDKVSKRLMESLKEHLGNKDEEEGDAQYIADYGTKLNKIEALAFFPYLDPEKFDK